MVVFTVRFLPRVPTSSESYTGFDQHSFPVGLQEVEVLTVLGWTCDVSALHYLSLHPQSLTPLSDAPFVSPRADSDRQPPISNRRTQLLMAAISVLLPKEQFLHLDRELRPPTPSCRPSTADRQLPIANHRSTMADHRLPTSDLKPPVPTHYN